jgi:membrane fusion protein, multidrug efflux system
MSAKRKTALAAAAAFQKALSDIDEVEAQADAADARLAARCADIAEAEARLKTVCAELVKAETEFERWRQASSREQTKANQQIDKLAAQLQELQAALSARRAEHDSILGGIISLKKRLTVE